MPLQVPYQGFTDPLRSAGTVAAWTSHFRPMSAANISKANGMRHPEAFPNDPRSETHIPPIVHGSSWEGSRPWRPSGW